MIKITDPENEYSILKTLTNGKVTIFVSINKLILTKNSYFQGKTVCIYQNTTRSILLEVRVDGSK